MPKQKGKDTGKKHINQNSVYDNNFWGCVTRATLFPTFRNALHTWPSATALQVMSACSPLFFASLNVEKGELAAAGCGIGLKMGTWADGGM